MKDFRKIENFLYGFYQGVIFIFFIPLFFILAIFFRFNNYFRKKLDKKPKIIWAPTPIITIYYNSKADRLLGYKSDTLVYKNYVITNSSLFNYNLEKIFKNRLSYFFVPHILVFFWAILRYDIFHFYYNQGLLFPSGIAYYLELPILKLMGKKKVNFCLGF